MTISIVRAKKYSNETEVLVKKGKRGTVKNNKVQEKATTRLQRKFHLVSLAEDLLSNK